jgi:hypothetical protein
VSLLPVPNRTLIETSGAVYSFFDRCFFQFYEEKLYIITINLDREKTDHYAIFSSLCAKYGDPASLSPEKSVWQNDAVIMTLERPLTLKYVDVAVFRSLLDESAVGASADEFTRTQFLEGL